MKRRIEHTGCFLKNLNLKKQKTLIKSANLTRHDYILKFEYSNCETQTRAHDY